MLDSRIGANPEEATGAEDIGARGQVEAGSGRVLRKEVGNRELAHAIVFVGKTNQLLWEEINTLITFESSLRPSLASPLNFPRREICPVKLQLQSS
jgi:hypothetical protein